MEGSVFWIHTNNYISGSEVKKNLGIWNTDTKSNSHINGRVADPELFFSDPDPDPSFKDVSAQTPDPDPVSDPSWERELRGKLTLYSWNLNYDDIWIFLEFFCNLKLFREIVFENEEFFFILIVLLVEIFWILSEKFCFIFIPGPGYPDPDPVWFFPDSTGSGSGSGSTTLSLMEQSDAWEQCSLTSFLCDSSMMARLQFISLWTAAKHRQGWKKPGFFKKNQPSGFFGVFGFLVFFLVFFIYLPRRESTF